MSIERYFKCYSLVCDYCGTTLGADSFEDARRMQRENGWSSRKVDGEWENLCPSCQLAEKKRPCE